MPIPVVPPFPFPQLNTVADLALLMKDKKVLAFLGDMENARQELNKVIGKYNKVENLEGLIASAKAEDARLQRLVSDTEERTKELLKAARDDDKAARVEAKRVRTEVQTAFNKQLAEARADLAKLEKQTAVDYKALGDAKVAQAIEHSEAREELALHLEAADALRADYETKLRQLREAMGAARQ